MNTILGLPAHPLLVHAVVVLVPLSALGAIACALLPRVRGQIGWYVAAGAALDVVLVPLATGSGEALERHVARSAELERHTRMAGGLLPFVLGLALGAVALMVLHHLRTGREAAGGRVEAANRSLLTAPWVTSVVVAVTILGGVGSLGQAMRIGHSGASATWDDVPSVDTGGGTGAGSNDDPSSQPTVTPPTVTPPPVTPPTGGEREGGGHGGEDAGGG